MSLKGFKEVAANRYELEIVIDSETFGGAIKTAYRRGVKKINVPGFRKGKAPLSVIEKFYGEEVFFEDALNILYPAALDEAVKEAGLEMIEDKIDFDLVSISKKDGAHYKLTITTKPVIEIGEYKGLSAEKVAAEASDEEIEAEISRLAERNARMVTVEDRAAENGDITVIDFEGFVDGVAFEGGKGEGHSLTLGSGQFIPGFEDQIVGHNTDDEFDVNVTFPEEYHAEELKGKEAVFKCKLHEIKKKELPEIDDEFVKDVSEFDTLDELKADYKTKITERKEKEASDDVENQLIDQLVESVKGEIPEAMYEKAIDNSINDFDYRLQMQGMNLQTYLQYVGGSVEEFRENFRAQAERQVKVRLALEKIAALENIEAGEEEIAAEFDKLAASYGVPAEQVKAAIPEKEVVADIVVGKAIAVVKDSANVKEVAAKSEKPAKKAPAKKTATKKADGETAEKPAKKSSAKKTTAKKADGEATEKPAAKKTPAKKTAKKAEEKTDAE